MNAVVVTTRDWAPGFRLAGVRVVVAADAPEAAAALAELAADPDTGVLAVHEPFLAALEPARRRALEARTFPILVALPAGGPADAAAQRRARLSELLARAVGWRLAVRSGDAP